MLLSIALAHWVDERWLLLAVFVGLNLIQSPITGFCATGALIKALGFGDAQPANPPDPPKSHK